MFYTFIQNNTWGIFNVDENVAQYVIIEADSSNDAIERAKTIGLYFDGKGDCSCCGDRWNEYNASYDRTEVPSIDGTSIEIFNNNQFIHNRNKDTYVYAIVHYKIGASVAYHSNKSKNTYLTKFVIADNNL